MDILEFEDREIQQGERQLLEEAHDKAMELTEESWVNATRLPVSDMYIKCSNGDRILCNEAQELFNQFYKVQ